VVVFFDLQVCDLGLALGVACGLVNITVNMQACACDSLYCVVLLQNFHFCCFRATDYIDFETECSLGYLTGA